MIQITYDTTSYKEIVKIKKKLLSWGYKETEAIQSGGGGNPQVTVTFRKAKK